MIWSHWDVAFAEGLSAAQGWAAEHGHLLPPTTAVWNGHPVGVWAKNLRTAGRRAVEIEARREAGLPVGSTAGTLTEERRDALEAIDPSWCPAWPVAWQRAYVLCRQLIEAGAPLPTAPGQTTVQGEDLGAWILAQRLGWDQLAAAQQWMLENMLDLNPADPSERPQAARTQADKWTANIQPRDSSTPARATSECPGNTSKKWTGCRTSSARSSTTPAAEQTNSPRKGGQN
jgi:hypothetical protein